MMKQPDAAEKVLQASDDPMHYTAIVEEAVRLGLIIRTEKNAKWLSRNVRKAVDKDDRFIKINRGVFDLVSRQPKSEKQEEVIAMSNSIVPENASGNLTAMMTALDLASGILEVPMEKVRDVFCQRRNGSVVAQQIEAALLHHGLGHFPVSLNVKQHIPVILYRLDSAAGRLVKAANQGDGSGDRYLQALHKIGEIVQSLEADEQL